MAYKRKKLPRGRSRRMFSRNADLTHKKNGLPGNAAVMRGGIRF